MSNSGRVPIDDISQALVAALFDRWAAEHNGNALAGFASHVRSTVALYEERRDAFLRAAEQHLAGLAEWTPPDAGMFVWLRLLGVADTHELIMQRALDAKVRSEYSRSASKRGQSRSSGQRIRSAT